MNFDDDGGGVDFLGDLEVVEFAGGFEFAHADEGDVHQGDGLFVAPQFLADATIDLVGFLDGFGAGVEGDLVDGGEEGGVAAVVGPVGVQHANFGESGGAAFLRAEIFLGEGDVGLGHGEGHGFADLIRGIC